MDPIERHPSTGSINTESTSEWTPSTPDVLDMPVVPVASGSSDAHPVDSMTKRSAAKGSRKAKWLAKLEATTAASLRREKCCKSLKCFQKVDYSFYMTSAKRLLNASTNIRRDILKTFLGSNNKFFYDAKPVCVVFLKEGFHFSTVMIAEVSSGKVKRPLSSSSAPSSRVQSVRSDNVTVSTRTSSTTESPSDSAIKKKSEAIVSFVLRMAEDCGDLMPHRTEVHLPFHHIQELFPIFEKDFHLLYPNVPPTSKSYFRKIWVQHCKHVKVMRSCRFTVCDKCESIRSQMRDRIVKGESTSDLKAQRLRHLKFISNERMEYQKKKDRARLHSSEYCSLIIDGADQSAFGLPHFTTKTKTQRGHALKVKLVGLLEHRLRNQLTLFTMTQEHQTGANHIVEVIHRFIERKREEGPLPPKFFLQLDNCSRENKNKYVMGYLELLVARSVFKSVDCGFLPVGHTHEDVDQAFSSTSSKLRVTNAATLADLHTVLRSTYGGQVQVGHMKRVANWSGLCDETGCLKRIDKITNWRYFNFTTDGCENPNDESTLRTICNVKQNCDDEWQELYPKTKESENAGVLRACPNLSLMPDLKIKCPDGLEEVNKRLYSEEERINDVDKTIALHELRDFVFQDRVDKCHWDLERSVETEHERERAARKELEDDSNAVVHGDSGLGMGDGAEVGASSNQLNSQCGSVAGPSSSSVRASVSNTHARPSDTSAQAPGGSEDTDEISKTPTTTPPHSKVDYKVGSFVLVKNDEQSGSLESSFWVAKVVQVNKDGTGSSYASKLVVHWYDRDRPRNGPVHHYQMKYYPLYLTSNTKRRKTTNGKAPSRHQLKKPSHDIIHTDTVLVSFDKLTKTHTIPLQTLKRLTK